MSEICLSGCLLCGVSAYELLGGHFVLENGFRMTYNIDYETITDSETVSAIHGAFDDWQWHLNDAVDGIDLNAYFSHSIYENVVADIGIRALPEVYADGILCEARTDLYDINGQLVFGADLRNTNWVRAEIVISSTEFSHMNLARKQATISHEIGHVFGLAHNSDMGTIMHVNGDKCTAFVPTLDDIQGVYAIYG